MNSLRSFRIGKNITRASLAAAAILAGVQCAGAEPPKNIRLLRAAKGAEAIRELGVQLPEVAKAYGHDVEHLTALFHRHASLAVDRHGALHYACNGLAVDLRDPQHTEARGAVANALTAASSTTQLAAGTTVDVFQLHSLPGATRVIYLDFNGHTTTGTSWNSAYTAGAPIVSQPFDTDGDPTTFSAAERAAIQSIWQRVAEDYAPFAIDVTTQDPGLEGLRKTSTSDLSYGVRVVISPTNWYDGGAGGTAYIGSFNWNSDTPCWIFTGQLGNYDKYIAEAVSHEVGHTLGLYHDGVGGTSPSEYYFGQGDWAPIMGVGYYKSIVQFSKGDYANATNTQDDFAVIATYAPLAGDDHGNTLATATLLSGPNVANGGTIERSTDIDLFRFDTGAGPIALSIVSPSPSPDLHIKAELLNSAGQVLQTNAITNLSAAFTPTLAVGTYYLRITGIGAGDPTTTGYSSYGSVGNYLITGTIVYTTAKQAPTAVATASTTTGVAALTVAFAGQNSSDSDGSIVSYAWDFGNGATSAAMSPTYTYTTAGSYNATLTVTDNDGLLGAASVTITVTAPVNQIPMAVASSSVTNGVAPVAIAFSSAGSRDPDGTIASYAWSFGDGTTSTSAAPSKTYSTPGSYTARLTVTDNRGATASATVAVTIAGDPNTNIDLRQYTLASTKTSSGTNAIATIFIKDRLGRPVSGATITLAWSGSVSGTTSGKTDSSGKVVLTSSRTKRSGSITGTIKAISPPTGVTYDATIYAEPMVRSVTVP